MKQELWMQQMFVDEHAAFELILDAQPISHDLTKAIIPNDDTSVASLKVLDLCCGHGRIARHLASHVKKVVGVDFSEPLIKRARELSDEYANVDYVQADARTMSSGSKLVRDEFDLILRLYTSLGYFSFDEELVILQQCREVASPRARIIYDTFNGSWFRGVGKFSRSREFGGITLDEEYEYMSENGTELCLCRWGCTAFAEPIEFTLNVYDEASVKELFANSGWKLTQISGNLERSAMKEPWERLFIFGEVS